MFHRIIFGLGSNLGDREKYLNLATDLLQERLGLQSVKKSTILENPAMLLPNSPKEWDRDFLNIGVSGGVDLGEFSPEKILQITQQIEKDLGRGEHERWSPRVIDIDILAIGNLRVEIEGRLKVPHPGLFKRDFFVRTASEIEPWILSDLEDRVEDDELNQIADERISQKSIRVNLGDI